MTNEIMKLNKPIPIGSIWDDWKVVPYKLFRFEDKLVAKHIDIDGNMYGAETKLYLFEYPIISFTMKGCWIQYYLAEDNKKFVNMTTKKRFALPTIEEARQSFIRRKEVQMSMLKQRMERASRALDLMESLCKTNS